MKHSPPNVEQIDIAVLDMGGTINGILQPNSSTPSHSRVISYLQEHSNRLGIKVLPTIVAMKDSRAIQSTDREALVAAIQRQHSLRVLVPHGTFTMAETGKYLLQSLGEASRLSVILVGAMTPLGEPRSDAPGNPEFAIGKLREAPVGVWIAMNPNLWDPRIIEKDPKSGTFRVKAGV